MRNPIRFDPNRLSESAEQTYNEFGVTPGIGRMLIGNRPTPAIHHEFEQSYRNYPINFPLDSKSWHAPNINRIWFQVPHESGLLANVDLVSDVDRKRPPIVNVSGAGGMLGREYEGPEQVLDMLKEHSNRLEDEVSLDPEYWKHLMSSGRSSSKEHLDDIQRNNPTSPVSGRWLDDTHGAKDYKLIIGRMNPALGYQFTENARTRL